MWGTILLSQLILLPALVILAWLYIRTRPHGHDIRVMVRFDILMLAGAVLGSVVGVLWVGGRDIGSANRIWKPVLSVITTFHIFPLVLCIGWWLRRRWYPAPRRPDPSS